MHWHYYVSYFFGGAFLANFVPHFTNGISGRSFPTPFASPPGQGLSSPLVNVLWGSLNLVIGYFLVFWVGNFQMRSLGDMGIMGLGALAIAMMLSRGFGRVFSAS